MPPKRTLRSVTGRATLAAVMLALGAGILSVAYDCSGVPRTSEQCLWSRSLFLLTSGIWFLAAWPMCFAAGLFWSWWKDITDRAPRRTNE